MHIAIDARMYHIKGGHGTYLRNLIDNLQDIDTENKYTLLMHSEGLKLWEQKNKNFTPLFAPSHWYTLREQTHFLKTLNKLKPDLTVFPHWNVPLLYRRPFVVTIHDLILLEHKTSAASTRNPLFFWIKYATFRLILKRTLKKAQHIITVSEFAKNQIENHYPYLGKAITTVHNGVATKKTPAKYKIQNTKYFLYTGTAYPHKNLHTLLHAFSQFTIRFGHNYKLILAGANTPFYQKLLKTDPAMTLLENNTLHFEDAPSNGKLAQLQKNATAVICPALMEGFGLPPLEAGAQTTASICSDIPAHREVMKDTAIFFDPRDPESLITKMHRITTDNNRRYFLARKAKQRVSTFSWKNSANLSLKIYKKAL